MHAIIISLSLIGGQTVDVAEARQQYYEARKAAATRLVRQYRAAIDEEKKGGKTIESKKLQREMNSFVEAERKALDAIEKGGMPGSGPTPDGTPESEEVASDPAEPAREQRDIAEVFQMLANVVQEANKEGSTFAKKAKEEQLLGQLKLDGNYIARWIVKDISHVEGNVFEIGVAPAFALAQAASSNFTRMSHEFEKPIPRDFALNTVAGDGFYMAGPASISNSYQRVAGWDLIGTFHSPITNQSYRVLMKAQVYDLQLQNPPKQNPPKQNPPKQNPPK